MRLHFHGGAFDGCQLSLAASYVPTTLYLVKSPNAGLEVLIVGTERVAPGPAFWDAVEYRLDRDASTLAPHPEYPGMEVGEAVYRA